MRRYYSQRAYDRTMGLFVRADRGGDRLLARGMSVATAERITRLLNKDADSHVARTGESTGTSPRSA